MRTTTILACLLLSALLTACSGVDIEPSSVDQFAAGNYQYYKWRTAPLPTNSTSSDPFYAIDPVMRREVDAGLQARGYILDKTRAQFSVDYLYAIGMREGAQSEQASNISPVPSVTPNRQVDQASVDNAIALGGVKETANILLQFNDMDSNAQVWQVLMTKIVENANRVDTSRLDQNLSKSLERALKNLPQATVAGTPGG